MEDIVARYGEVQGRFEELDGYALEGRAREVLAGLSFSQEMMDGDVGALSGGWKMRVALARILLMRPDAMLLDEPSNHLDLESLIWLEQFLKGYEGALLLTSHDREFMNRIVTKVLEIDGGSLTPTRAVSSSRAAPMPRKQAQFAPASCWPGRSSSSGAQGTCLARRPVETALNWRKIRGGAPGAAEPRLRVSAGAALGRGRGEPQGRAQALWQPQHLRGSRFPGAPPRALVRDGRQRRWQVDAAQAGGGLD
jgi:energy-coupling factor transporter ATP-binding protein EcfA2